MSFSVVILAAGMGTRLGKLTHEKPKCMLEFQGQTLLKRQLDLLNESDIETPFSIFFVASE